MAPKTEEDEGATRASRCQKQSFIFLLLSFSFVPPVGGFSLRSCRISNNSANCVSQWLSAVPRDIPRTVVGIDLSKNEIPVIQSDDFQNLTVLVTLYLDHNSITKINRGAFADLKSLEELNLNNNKLYKLPGDVFQGLSRVTRLAINGNLISEVSPTAFRSMARLEWLNITHNQLRSLTPLRVLLQQLPNLQGLVVSSNHLTAFRSSELTNSSLRLQHLDLFGNPLRVFGVSADVFPELNNLTLGGCSGQRQQTRLDVQNETFLSRVRTLDISGLAMSLRDVQALLGMASSSLTSLTMNGMKRDLGGLIDAACSLPTVQKLQLKKNNLHNVTSGMFRLCVHVTELDLRNNEMREISEDAFRSLKRLRILHLSFNNLLSVPAATRGLPSLTKLDLNNCGISSLQCDDFANHTRLTVLNLYSNSIPRLSRCFFEGLRELKVLKLQTNHITELSDAFQPHLPNLKTLHLNGNQIAGIKPGELGGLSGLETLSLHSNQIQSIQKGSFDGLTNLTYLLLELNQITEKELQTGAFNDLVNLKRLDLSDNKILYKNCSALPRPPFSNLSRLEDLSLRGQGHRGWRCLPRNLLQGLSNLRTFSSRNIRLDHPPSDIFTFTPRLETLDIQANNLQDLTSEHLAPLRNLRSLYISKTNLNSLDFLIKANLTKLEYVQARENQFPGIQEEVIESLPALVYVDLFGNSFMCNCDNERFIEWVRSSPQTQVSFAYNLTCNSPPSVRNKLLMDVDLRLCLLDNSFTCFVTTACAVVCFTVAPLVHHFMRWQLVSAYYIFLAWLADTKHKNKSAPHQYDAFVSYNAHDEPWVINELLPKLEGEQGWRLCLHHRDFEPGRPIISNITDAIYGSRKTICVISRRYLESEWCSREIQAASFRLFDENKDVLILVFLEEIPTAQLSPYHRMRKLLKRQTYLSWPRAEDRVQLFWEKLRRALRSGEEPGREQLLLLTVTD